MQEEGEENSMGGVNESFIKEIPSETIIIKSTGEELEVSSFTTKEQALAILESQSLYAKFKSTKMLKKYGEFYFLFYQDNVIFKENISDENIVRVVFLATYLNYDNYLRYDNQKFIYKADIQKILKLSDKTFYNFFNEMELIGLLSTQQDGRIKLNRRVFKKGKADIKKNYTRMFNDTIRNMYNGTKPQDHKKLAIFFKLIPFISYEYNILALNPEETEPDFIKPMTIGNICDVFNINKKNKKRMLNSLLNFKFNVRGEELNFFRYTLGNTDWYSGMLTVNPLIAYNGKAENFKQAILIYGDFDKNEKNFPLAYRKVPQISP